MAAQSYVIQDDINKIRAADRASYRSLPIMTKYEFNEIMGLRTMHLSRNAPIMVDVEENFKVTSNMQLRQIALRELEEKKLPYMVKRVMPNGKIEYWPIAELDTTAVRHLMRM